MTINEEVEQIIIRTIISKGVDVIPKDLSFINKYEIKDIYFMGLQSRSATYNKIIKQGLIDILKNYKVNTSYPLLKHEYLTGGKKRVMTYLKDEIYYKTFYRYMRYGK